MIPAPLPEAARTAVVALDWADRQHAGALFPSASSDSQTGWLNNTTEAIDRWAAGRGGFGGLMEWLAGWAGFVEEGLCCRPL